MNVLKTDALKEGMYFTHNLYLDKSFLLLDPSTPITKDLLKELEAWNFNQVMCEGTIALGNADSAQKENAAPKENKAEEVADYLGSILDQPDFMRSKNEDERLEIVRKVYNQYIDWVTKVYTHFSTHTEFNKTDISAKIRNLCIFMKDNVRFFLRIANENYPFTRTYLVYHSMRSIVISLVIGLQLRIPLSKLIDLGITAMLHEIGMLRIPPQLYLTDRTLTKREKKQLTTHPLLGCQILQNADFPMNIQNGVIEHHERENGSGYPRALTSERISLFGKIVAIACVYDGIMSDRGFKGAKTSHQAIVELLRNESHQFDPTITKALLYCLSLYPIGTYVFLANGKVAVVTDINPADFKNPIVEIVGETNEDGKPVKIQTNETETKINRVLTNKEISDVLKSLSTKN